MAGRPGPALFELLRDKTGTRGSTATPTPAAQPAPVERPVPPPRPAPAALPPADFERSITLSMQTIWLAVGGLILVVFLIWVLAFSQGKRRGEREMAPYVDRNSGAPINEPLRNGNIPTNPSLVTPGPPKQNTPTQAPPAPAPGGDPRVAGFNYLTIASRMDKETATRCTNFLTENGVAAFAIPVAKANNPPTYTVYALQGITREQLRAKTPEKTELEDRVKRLGKIWQKEHKGGTDFSQFYWDKFGS